MMKVLSQNVNSSAISHATWDPEYDILHIRFPSETCWIYYDVPFEVYNSLINANSAGNYFNKNIRNNKKFVAQKVYERTRETAHAYA